MASIGARKGNSVSFSYPISGFGPVRNEGCPEARSAARTDEAKPRVENGAGAREKDINHPFNPKIGWVISGFSFWFRLWGSSFGSNIDRLSQSFPTPAPPPAADVLGGRMGPASQSSGKGGVMVLIIPDMGSILMIQKVAVILVIFLGGSYDLLPV